MSPVAQADSSYVHPLVIAAVLIAAVLIYVLPRKKVIAPFLAASLLIPMDQVLVIGPFHFQMLRCLILIAWTRVFVSAVRSRTPMLGTRMNWLDRLVLFFAAFDAFNYIVLWDGATDAITNRCGVLYTVLGAYFLFRCLIRSEEDALFTIKVLAFTSVVIAASMTLEQVTGHNPYTYLGGERAWARMSLMARESTLRKVRAMGSFQHPLLAGTFGGVTLPLYIGLWLKRRDERLTACIGLISATIIVVAAASSTPILAYVCGILALLAWPFRRHMRALRWGAAFSLIILHVVMKAPVWALIQRVDIVGGSSGFHRYYLVDQFITRMSDWWLFGAKSTAEWGPDMWDHANQYVAVGEATGMLPLILFIAIIVCAFKYVGRAAKKHQSSYTGSGLFYWVLGAALFAHAVAFIGISYFDQIIVAWWSLLAMISVMAFAPSVSAIPAEATRPSKIMVAHWQPRHPL